MFRFTSLITILGIALLVLLNGCSGKPKTSGTSKAAQTPEGEVWTADENQNGQSNGTVRQIKASKPGIQRGMTYDSVIAQLGQPTQWEGQYSWTTLSGKFEVAFNDQNEAMYYNFQSANAAPNSNSGNPQENWERARSQYESDHNTTKEIAQLVQNRASFNSISAHLGGTPAVTGGRGTWQLSGKRYLIAFEQGVVSRVGEISVQ